MEKRKDGGIPSPFWTMVVEIQAALISRAGTTAGVRPERGFQLRELKNYGWHSGTEGKMFSS